MSNLNYVLSNLNDVTLTSNTSLATINSDLSSLLSFSNSFPSNYANITSALCNVQSVLNSNSSIYQQTPKQKAEAQKAINAVFVSNKFGDNAAYISNDVSNVLTFNINNIESLLSNTTTVSYSNDLNVKLNKNISNIEAVMKDYTLSDTFKYGNEDIVNPLIDSVCKVQTYLNNYQTDFTSSQIKTFNEFIQQFTFPNVVPTTTPTTKTPTTPTTITPTTPTTITPTTPTISSVLSNLNDIINSNFINNIENDLDQLYTFNSNNNNQFGNNFDNITNTLCQVQTFIQQNLNDSNQSVLQEKIYDIFTMKSKSTHNINKTVYDDLTQNINSIENDIINNDLQNQTYIPIGIEGSLENNINNIYSIFTNNKYSLSDYLKYIGNSNPSLISTVCKLNSVFNNLNDPDEYKNTTNILNNLEKYLFYVNHSNSNSGSTKTGNSSNDGDQKGNSGSTKKR